MEVTFNSYIQREAEQHRTVDIIDVTINGGDVPDWRWTPADHLGITNGVLAGRTAWLSSNEEPVYVEPTLTEEQIVENRRDDRTDVFSRTLDVMNTIWYSSLTAEQQAEIAVWRQAWLDYPATGVRPEDLAIFN